MKTDHENLEINKSNFQEEVLGQSGIIIVQFCSDWSGNCHIMTPVIHDLSLEFKNRIKFGNVDVERDEELTDKYRIRELPTLLFFRDGEIIDHIVGPVPKDIVRSKLKELLSGN